MNKKYLFICGCPRSGTTALVNIFNWHPQILLGIERYSALFRRNPASMTRDLFDKQRFLDFREGDCGYTSFEFHAYSNVTARQIIPESIDNALIVGDKITQLYTDFSVFERDDWSDTEVFVVQIIRNALDVARSYEARMRDPNDNWRESYMDGIREWELAMDRGLQVAERGESRLRFLVVNYDQIFQSGKEKFFEVSRRLIQAIGLEAIPEFESGIQKIYAAGDYVERRRSARGELISNEEIMKLISQNSLNNYRRLREYGCSCS